MSKDQIILSRTPFPPTESLELLGDLHPLLVQLGSAEGLVRLSTASATLGRGAVESHETLRVFLGAYQSEILLPLELPTICRAYQYARGNQTRELVILDRQVGAQFLLRNFAAASKRVGQSQLKRLRPLRDARVVHRYLQAVERHEAQGWHTLVYGLTLALYSLPVCQGLMNYARTTLSGFVHTAARSLKLSEHDCRELVEDFCADLPRHLEGILTAERASASTA